MAFVSQAEPGRSSASNSDVDSESDDFWLDAARVMALNRMQQQQLRLRVGAQLGGGSSLQQHHHHNGDSLFRLPPADSEYQSGDSIDSTMAEDSCGSDSSLSDVNEY